MSDAPARIRERVLQNRAARQDALDASAPTLSTAATRTGAPYLPGAQVFDAVSGLEGTVYALRRASPTDDTTVSVQLGDGAFVWRAAEQLIGRPTPPIVK